MPAYHLPRGAGDIFGVKQSGKGGLSQLCLQELTRRPALMEHARAAAAEALSGQRLTPALKAALVAYGYWAAGDAPEGGPAAGGGGGSTSASSSAGGRGTGKSGVTGA